MKTITFFSTLLLLLFIFSCEKDPKPSAFDRQALDQKLQQAFELVSQDAAVLGAILSVEIPKRDYIFQQAIGNATPDLKMVPEDQFYTASIGKMITAALILKLSEENKLQLDDPMAKYLGESLISGIHVFEGVDYTNQVTIRQLLNHTSGLLDFLFEGASDPSSLPPFIELVFADVNKLWTAEEIIAFHKQNFQAFAKPGRKYHYSDTNYQLLGLIIEAIAGRSLHEVAKEKIFDPLNMDHTYFFFREDPRGVLPGREASWSFLQNIPLTFPGMGFDWAAGGLITTAKDLTNFLDGVVKGKFLNEGSKRAMQTWTITGEFYYYGLGLIGIPDPGDSNKLVMGHEGATNSMAFYAPRYDAFIVGTYNQLAVENEDITVLLDAVLKILEDME